MTTPMINAWRACRAHEAMLLETDETEDGAEHDDDYDDRCDEIIAEIRGALPDGWEAVWTGNGNQDTEDIRIEYTR